MRPTRLTLLSFLAVVLGASGCGSSSGNDAGGDAGPVIDPTAFAIHYHRPLADYTGWNVATTAGAVQATAAQGTKDGWGATFALNVSAGASTLTFTLQNGATSEPQSYSVDVSGPVREAWILSGFATPLTVRPPAVPNSITGQVAVYYKRADTDYAGWGLHIWGDQVSGTDWGAPLQPQGLSDVIGDGFLLDVAAGGSPGNCTPGNICVIIHKGDTKDPGPDMTFDPKLLGNIVFLLSGSASITSSPRIPGAVDISGASAHLLRRNVVAWKTPQPSGATYELRWSPTVEIHATAGDVVGGQVIPLQAAGALEAGLAGQLPQLSGFSEFTLDAGDLGTLKQALKGQLVAVARSPDGGISATAVQIGYALDDLFAYQGALGVVGFDGGAPTLALWAPTARAVVLNVFDDAKAAVASVPLTEGDSGVWSASGPATWSGKYYQYQVQVFHPGSNKVETFTVTDPYSVNLSTNGVYSQIVDLADPSLQPAGWNTFAKPALAAPEDMVVYETHVRDFSAFDPTVPADRVGRYLAFVPATDGGALTAGQQHLQALAQAGLTHVHLLPAFDIASVDEDPAARVDLASPFDLLCSRNTAVPMALCTQFHGQTVLQAIQSFAGDSDQQQALAGYLQNLDAFNWGYDPFHYGAVEGSYASTAEGTAKIVEFRRMVMGLAALGLRTVMDVVYNHTNASGPASPKSVLDKVVPGYYHRLDPLSGSVLTSSCCADTATERRMMEKLMVDTMVRWARDYKVDGFRFDLMGLHYRSNIQEVQAALAALTPGHDGVDGSKLYLYGEGWAMDELQKDQWGAATQANMAGTGVGTFNDRIRDGVRGGGPFDNGAALRKNQGFANGLYYDPNELSAANPTTLSTLIDQTVWTRISMAAALYDFRIQTRGPGAVPANAVGYNGPGAGYTQDPQEAINYVSAHDNQTLWDIMAYKLPTATPIATRVRAYDVALDTVLLGQGIPFFHLGDDVLRSKSMDKNSYDSGDWFNQVDWSGQKNGWKNGLPMSSNDSGNWGVIRTVFGDATAAAGAADIAAASAHFREMLRVRKSSLLFRLRTKADVMTRVDFANAGASQIPGVIAMTITDGTCAGADLDPARDGVVVIINADKVPHDIPVPGATGFTLHAILQASADPVVKTASFTAGTFTVPARTTAVFEQLQSGAQGAGLPCNTR